MKRTMMPEEQTYLENVFPKFNEGEYTWGIACGPDPCGAEEFIYEVIYGVYGTTGGCLAELAMRWYPLGNGRTTPRLEVFRDAFVLLGSPLHKLLIEKLSDMGDFGPAEFIGKLQADGVCFSYMEQENG